MNIRSVIHVTAHVLGVTALGMGLCAAASFGLGDPPAFVQAMAASALITLLAGGLVWTLTRGPLRMGRREGFGIVAIGWFSASLFGSLPYLGSGLPVSFFDAFFETVSGFTTTGASVFASPESLPRGLLLWRALTQWLGGMGVLVLCVAILPFLGVGALQIFRAEIPGPAKERLAPRIATTAKLLWGVYLLLTAVQAALLWAAGMGGLDAVCHALTTMATGGFSTRAASIRGFDSAAVEWIVIAFMFLAGVNFSLHYALLRGRGERLRRDGELRGYAGILLAAAAWLAFWIHRADPGMGPGDLARTAAFQATSILTTTGYATRNFSAWPLAAQVLLLALMLIGGCSGSTAGGMKVVRVLLVFKAALRDVRRFISPQAVFPVRLAGVPVPGEVVAHAGGFFSLFLGLFAAAVWMMSWMTPDFRTALSAVAACLGNVGPGLGAVGPDSTYEWVPPAGKMLLAFCMLAGRLELYTVIVLFMPRFWRR